MSDVPQQTSPDLHAIFGIDGDDDAAAPTRRARSSATATTLDADGCALDGEPEIELDGQPARSSVVARARRRGADSRCRGRAALGHHRPSRAGGSSPRFLTDVIVELGLASREQVDEALESSRSSGTTPERVLLDSGALTQDGLARALAERYGLDHLDLGVFSVDMTAANLVSTPVAKRYQAVPVAFADKRTLLVAMADPSNVLAVDDIAIMTGYEVRVAVAPPEDIADARSRAWTGSRTWSASGRARRGGRGATAARSSPCTRPPRTRRSSSSSTSSSRRPSSGAPPTCTSRPTGRELRVRFRIDGVLQDITTVPRQDGRRRRLAHEDHGRAEHRRAAPAPGRPRRAVGRRPPHRPARGDAAERPRRGRRDARPRQGIGRRRARQARHGRRPSASASNAPAARPTARCS